MKRLTAVILLLLIIGSFASCGGEMYREPLNAAEVGCVTVSDAVYSNYLYVIEDDEAIAELTALYNGLRYVPTDEVSFVDLVNGTLYMFAYQPQDEADTPLASAWISPQGYVYFSDDQQEDDPDAEMPVYRLTSAFDEERLKAILEKYNEFQ